MAMTEEQRRWLSGLLASPPPPEAAEAPGKRARAGGKAAPPARQGGGQSADADEADAQAAGTDGADAAEGEAPQGEAPGGAAEIVGQILGVLKDVKGDVTLTADRASALPKGKGADAFRWSGPARKGAHFGPEQSVLFRSTLAEAAIEVRWYYDGKYINDFGARLLSAEVDKWTSSLEITVKVDHIDPRPAQGVARIDYLVTFAFSNITAGKKVTTMSGTAVGDGSGSLEHN